ncbi:mycofactocin biosynthesis chaperone MftB [Nocardia sp. NPDC051030]|uniref:mycofactocin biosynthesis chaperone MftB n=1 Tax=Nocardia sp. NPDC051030 TaxID=3155162 RepID=UPI0034380A9E
MECVASTDNVGTPRGFDPDLSWRLHPQVSVRPERFGALLYHFGNRRLSFVKSPKLFAVLRELTEAPSARVACARAGVDKGEFDSYCRALATLAASEAIYEWTSS